MISTNKERRRSEETHHEKVSNLIFILMYKSTGTTIMNVWYTHEVILFLVTTEHNVMFSKFPHLSWKKKLFSLVTFRAYITPVPSNIAIRSNLIFSFKSLIGLFHELLAKGYKWWFYLTYNLKCESAIWTNTHKTYSEILFLLIFCCCGV